MRTTKQITTILLSLMLLTFSVSAEQEKSKDKTPKKLKNQTHCPVMGGAIDSTVYTDIQGHRVYHCCPMCSKNLKKDPDTFFKKAAAEGIVFENIQTICPISGTELKDKKIYSDFDGRRIYLCSKKCKDTFNEKPQEILNKMDSLKDKKEMEKDSGDAHSGHNH